MKAVVYLHGKGGSAVESEHYKPLFRADDVIGIDYRADTPWEAGKEIAAAVKAIKEKYETIVLIANSIGAFFAMHAGIEKWVEKAYFISPIVDMERLIMHLMAQANVDESILREKGMVSTDFGEDLSWKYLCFVREHPLRWAVPTAVLYGSEDMLTSFESMRAFADRHGAVITVMPGGEHWFHTPEQMQFLDEWIKESESQTV